MSEHARHTRVLEAGGRRGWMWLCLMGRAGRARVSLRSLLGHPPLPGAAQPSSLGQLVGFDK